MANAKILSAVADNDRPDDGSRARLSILLTSAGGQVSLLRCFRDAAKGLGIECDIIAVDADPEISPACLLADSAFAVPPVDHDEYLDAIIDLSVRIGVRLIIPGSVLELEKLSLSRQRFADRAIYIAVGGPGMVAAARDAYLGQDLIHRAGGLTPELLDRETIRTRPELVHWPLIVKPRRTGDVALGLMRVHHPSELERVPVDAPVIYQLPVYGRHYVSQLFFDEKGQLVFCGTYQIERLGRGGRRVATIVEDDRIRPLMEEFAALLPDPFGPVHVDVTVDPDDRPVICGFQPLFAPDYVLLNRAGANIIAWLMAKSIGQGVDIRADLLPGLHMVRYEAPLFWTTDI